MFYSNLFVLRQGPSIYLTFHFLDFLSVLRQNGKVNYSAIWEFFTSAVGGDLSLESEKISRFLLSILANLNNAVVRMVSILPPILNSSNLF